MKDYIERGAVLEIATKARAPMDIREEEPDVAWVRGFNGALNSVYHLPAADVRPVVRGKWVVKGQDVICSACGAESAYNAWGASRWSKYCPNCGALNKGGEG